MIATDLPPEPFLLTRTGLVLDVRPVRPEDEPALTAFFAHVSPEDRRFRFLSSVDYPNHQQLLPLVTADHDRSESYIACDPATDEIVASGLFACDPDGQTAEVAVSIRADWRGRGVGWALLDILAEAARRRGVRRVISIESRANHAAIALEREMGFVAVVYDADPDLVLLAKRFDR